MSNSSATHRLPKIVKPHTKFDLNQHMRVNQSVASSMAAYQDYVVHLRTLATEAPALNDDRLLAALDGEPKRKLREMVSRPQIRISGAYFSGHAMANALVKAASVNFDSIGRILDPACGTGDLLVAVARRLPIRSTFSETLADWGNLLTGYDIHREFTEATKWRLALLARARFLEKNPKAACLDIPQISQIFPYIVVADGVTELSKRPDCGLIVMNPPFTSTFADINCRWSTGSTSLAAVFVDAVVQNAGLGTIISAILPDVLRTGIRYERWRLAIARHLDIKGIKPLGAFDEETDIDVFSLHGKVVKNANGSLWSKERSPPTETRISKHFAVHVGPYIPFREHGKGPWCPYVDVTNLPIWSRVHSVTKRVRFSGRLTKPPFVAVRRTSSPHDGDRALATIVTGERPVAVENHLVILSPHDGRLRTCRKLLIALSEKRTTAWINRRNRCRHLTVSLLKELPLWSSS